VQARTGIRVETLARELKPLPHLSDTGDRRWLHSEVITEFRRQAMQFLEKYFRDHKLAINVPKSEFVQKMMPRGIEPRWPTICCRISFARGSVAVAGDALDIPGRSKALGGAEGELARAIEMRFAESGLQPPPVSELIQTLQQKPKVVEGVVSFLVKQGTLVRLADGVYVHRDVIAEARRKMETRRGESIDVGAFKDFFGLSRKVAIPLLEYFDREGVTRRVGDQRQVL
jgi:Elongation factor SelB, winged helix.